MDERILALGREIRRRRQALCMTLEMLGEATGMTPNYIGNIESGQRDPGLSTIFRIAAGLRCTAGELLGLPELPSICLEAGRLISSLPEAVRVPLTATLRAMAALEMKQQR